MMSTTRSMPNQSVLDIVIGEYGSLEAAMTFCAANDIPVSEMPRAGTQFLLPAVIPERADEVALRYLRTRGLTIGTANLIPEPPVHAGMMARWVLVPTMNAELTIFGHIDDGEPFCSITYAATVDFINLNTLATLWPEPPNELINASYFGWYAVSPPPFLELATPASYVGEMAGRSLSFGLTDPYGVALDSYMVWTEPIAGPETGMTVRFVDVNENTAVWCPVTILFFELTGGGTHTIVSSIGSITTTLADWEWDAGASVMRGIVAYGQAIYPPPIMEVVSQKLVYREMGGAYMLLTIGIGPGAVELALAMGIYEIMVITGYKAVGSEVAQILFSYYSVVIEVTTP